LKSKQDHIDYWKALAIDDLESSALLFEGKKYLHALFFTHLALEKTCKACWINDNDSNIPPRTHNLNFLLSQTQLHLSTMQKEFLLEMNRFQIEGRYLAK